MGDLEHKLALAQVEGMKKQIASLIQEVKALRHSLRSERIRNGALNSRTLTEGQGQ